MSRKGENIYKRKYGRWEGRYIKARTPREKPSTVLCMLPPIMRYARKEVRQWQTLLQILRCRI